jgi:hypothetical protein
MKKIVKNLSKQKEAAKAGSKVRTELNLLFPPMTLTGRMYPKNPLYVQSQSQKVRGSPGKLFKL